MHDAELVNALKNKLNVESGSGKHAFYQVLPAVLRDVLGTVDYQPDSRFEEPRFTFLQSQIDFHNKSVVDIGCNLGFFSFSACMAGAAQVTSFEGNSRHAAFVEQAIALLSLHDKMRIFNQYFEFSDSSLESDIGILLNVLHHVGDDYGDKTLTISTAKETMLQQLNSMAHSYSTLIFQLGFNWRGDRNYPLFSQGTKQQMMDYITVGTAAHWHISAVAAATKTAQGQIVYSLLNTDNSQRDDALGEFLNRPVFILRSKLRE